MTRSYQIAKHAQALGRWFAPAESRRIATRAVNSGQAWKWPEPVQMELF